MSDECECRACITLEENSGCRNPNACALKSKALLDTLPPKWDPRKAVLDTPVPPEDEEGWTAFHPNLVTSSTLAGIFRIFTTGEPYKIPPDQPAQQILEVRSLTIMSACTRRTEDNAQAAGGIFEHDNSPQNTYFKVPSSETQSLESAEVIAVGQALAGSQDNIDLKIELGSKYAINAATKYLARHEDTGYISIPNAGALKRMINTLRAHKSKILFKESREQGKLTIKKARELAEIGLSSTLLPAPVQIDESMAISGAKLSSITQALAYRAIREAALQDIPLRRRSETTISHIKDCYDDMFGAIPTSPTIWKSYRDRDLSRKSRYFLWMATHDAYMVGSHWQRENYRPEIQERAICKHCDELETMDHILTKCSATGQEVIWTHTKALWEKKLHGTWYSPVLGTILGSALANFSDEKGKKIKGASRLYKILMIESAYLIWTLRCERVIQKDNEDFTNTEVLNRWTRTINDRLSLDMGLTNPTFGKKAMRKSKVLETWSGVLENEGNLPKDWIGSPGVLVGIGSGHDGAEEEGWNVEDELEGEVVTFDGG